VNFLQRMPQSAKVALVAALLVGAVATWYLGFVRPNQMAQQSLLPPAQTNPTPQTARPLEVLPLPFLVTEAPKTPTDTKGEAVASTPTAPAPKVTVPPNPFVPLIVENPAQATPVAQATPPASARPSLSPVTARPIPMQAGRVTVQQPITPLPQANLPATRPAQPSTPSLTAVQGQARLSPGGNGNSLPGSLSLSSGALPIRLAPLSRELSASSPQDQTTAALDPSLESSTRLDYARAELDARVNQVLQPTSNLSKPQEAVAASGMGQYVREQGLKLSGVVLGATNVAIFQTKDGFVVLPVGRTLPGSEILLKSLNTKEALLVRGSETLSLPVEDQAP